MKPFLFLFCWALLAGHVWAQRVEFAATTLNLPTDPTGDKTFFVMAKADRTLSSGSSITVTVSDEETRTATRGTDYEFNNRTLAIADLVSAPVPMAITVKRTATPGKIILLKLTQVTKPNQQAMPQVSSSILIIHLVSAISSLQPHLPAPPASAPEVSFRRPVMEVNQLKSGGDREIDVLLTATGAISRPVLIALSPTDEGSVPSAAYAIAPTQVRFEAGGPTQQLVKLRLKPEAVGKTLVLMMRSTDESAPVRLPNHLMYIRYNAYQPGTVQFAEKSKTVALITENQDVAIPLELKLPVGLSLTQPVRVKVGIAGGTATAGIEHDYEFRDGQSVVAFVPGGGATVPLQALVIRNTAKADRTIILRLTTDDPIDLGESFMTVQLVTKEADVNPFRLSLGSNFNFLDGPSLERLYADTYVFMPTAFGRVKVKYLYADAGGVLTEKVIRPIGFETGLYNSRSFLTNAVDLQDKTVEIFSNRKPLPDGRVQVDVNRVIDSSRTTLDNFGFYFNPMIRLNRTNSTVNVYGLLHLELIRRTIIQRSIFTPVSTTSTIPETRTITAEEARGVFRSYTSGTFTRQDYDTHIGVGLLIHAVTKNVEFRLKGLLTWGGLGLISRQLNQISSQRSNSFTAPQSQVMYVANFSLIERTSGIKIGGDVRGFIDRQRGQPLINYIYIAKEFDLSKFLNFGGKFD